MTNLTHSVYLAFYLYLIMLFVQWAVATFSKARAPHAIAGKISVELSHESFIFRAHRTFHNTLENGVLFMGTVLFAFVINYNSPVFALCVWVYLIARIIHMALYYAIATEKNPSPRSYFFLIGVVSNIVMLVMLGLRLAS